MIVSLISSLIDFVFVGSLFALCYFLQRNQNDSKSIKEGLIGFTLICVAQCVGLAGVLAIAVSAALSAGVMPIPQNILNLLGIVPLFQGIFAILALWNEHGILKGGSISLFHTRWFKKIEEFFQKVHETLKKYLKDPIVLEIAIYSFYSQAGTASTYVYVFSALSLNSMLMLCGLMMAFTFVKTILVWFIFHQIKLNLIHTLMIPTDIVPEKLTFYVYPLLLTLTGFCMLGQSFLGPYLPKFV